MTSRNSLLANVISIRPLLLASLVIATLVLCPIRVVGGDATAVSVDAARRVVKLYGAGGIRGLESYQTGILVSPSGHILTVLSTAIDSE